VRKTKNIFSPRASRIVRVLLIHPQKGWTIKDLSEEADVSIGFTHAVVMSLLDQGHAYRDDSYRVRVIDQVKLLQRWAAYHNYMTVNTFLHYHTFEKNIESLFSKMKETDDLEYALTVLAGAHVMAPYVRPTTVHFYIKEKNQAKTWVEMLDLRPVEKGGNVSMVLPYDAGVFYGVNKVDGVKVVSMVQLYADLFNYPARGEEASEMVLKALEKQWMVQKT
jgi:hypothetical protein